MCQACARRARNVLENAADRSSLTGIVATGHGRSSEHLAVAANACPENIVKFWSTFGQLLVWRVGRFSSVVIIYHVSNGRQPLAPRYLNLIVTAKRKLRQRVLRFSIEVRVHRKEFFRRDLRQLPSFEFPLNSAEEIPEKLDLPARREVELVVQRLKLHCPEIVDLLFQVPVSVYQSGLTDPDLGGYLCQREPLTPQFHKTLFRLCIFHTFTYARMTI